MEFSEYPKCLYMGGKDDAEYVVVMDADQEAEKREVGFAVIGESVETEDEPKRKPGRPRKTEAE